MRAASSVFSILLIANTAVAQTKTQPAAQKSASPPAQSSSGQPQSASPATTLPAPLPPSASTPSGVQQRQQQAGQQQAQQQPLQPAQAMEMDSLPPELGKAQVLTFDQAVSKALVRNPQAMVAYQEVQRAQAVVEQARSGSLPTLASTAYYQRLEGDRAIVTPGIDGLPPTRSVVSPANQVNLDFMLTVPIVRPQAWAQWWHAKDQVEVTKASAEDVRRQLAVATARTYLGIIAQHRVIEVAVRARDAARAHYQYAHQRWIGGYGTRVDEVRAAQEIAADESTLQSDVSQLAREREALGVLLGLDEPIDVEDVTLPELPTLDEALKEAATQRSDVILQRTRLVAAKHVERDNWADYAPTLALTFMPFFQDPPTSTLPRYGYQGLLTLNWVIFDGGLRYGQGHERESLRKEAELYVQGQVRQAQSDVRAADEEVRRSTSALKAAQDAAKLAGEGLALTNLAYRAGASTNIEVIDAERVARDAETAVAVAEDSWRQATLDALFASGRFPAK